MELNDEIMIAASKTRVYEALNDTEILTACIPGCEELSCFIGMGVIQAENEWSVAVAIERK